MALPNPTGIPDFSDKKFADLTKLVEDKQTRVNNWAECEFKWEKKLTSYGLWPFVKGAWAKPPHIPVLQLPYDVTGPSSDNGNQVTIRFPGNKRNKRRRML